MSTQFEETEQEPDEPGAVEAPPEMVLRRLHRQAAGSDAARIAGWLIVINMFVNFARFQDINGLGFLGSSGLTAAVSVFLLLFWLAHCSEGWTRQTKLMSLWLGVEFLRLLVGKFLDPNDSIVRNDFWQFQTWRDLAMQFTAFAFPIAVFGACRVNLNRLFNAAVVICLYLSYFSLRHEGQGPGGFLADENDLCLVLDMLLPFSLLGMAGARSPGWKAFCGITAVAALAGIVKTMSRGGFLGLVAVLAYLLLTSKKKAQAMMLLAAGLLVAVPLISGKYWQEVGSIDDETQGGTGTIQERFDTWTVAYRIWADPAHIVQGVGLGNAPWWFKDYEPPSRLFTGRSLSGRAMHSMYFQLLPELGLMGILLIGGILWSTWRGNVKVRHITGFLRSRLAFFSSRRTKEQAGKLPPAPEAEGQAEEADKRQAAFRLPGYLADEMEILEIRAKTINAAILGVLVAGLGISVLYYPPLWFLAGASAALQNYSAAVSSTSRQWFMKQEEELKTGE